MYQWVRLWLAGRTPLSFCWMGLHRWDSPGGHCERCHLCDEFFGLHETCRRAKAWLPAKEESKE